MQDTAEVLYDVPNVVTVAVVNGDPEIVFTEDCTSVEMRRAFNQLMASGFIWRDVYIEAFGEAPNGKPQTRIHFKAEPE